MIGTSVAIRNTVLTVVGVLARAALGERAFDPNGAVIVPIEAASRVTPKAGLRDITARMSPNADYRQVTREIEAYFQYRTSVAKVEVRSAEHLIDHLHRQMRLYTLLLGTADRASRGRNWGNERHARGRCRAQARNWDPPGAGGTAPRHSGPVLSEAMMLSLLGGVIGVVVAVLTTYGICRFTGWAYTVSVEGTLLGTLVAGGAGNFFGLYPPYQAARIDPVAALQG